MFLSEIYEQLTFGELSQVSLGGSEQGEISQENYNKVLPHIKMGLTALHKRFLLKQKELLVPLVSEETHYNLKGVANDLLKIERVYAKGGHEWVLNDLDNPLSILTPQSTSMQVPLAVVNQSPSLPDQLKTPHLRVVYRANHPPITEDSGADFPDEYEVDLPDTHLEALLLYIASRVHNPIGMANEFHAGNNYAALYEAECQRLQMNNLGVDMVGQTNRVNLNGWV